MIKNLLKDGYSEDLYKYDVDKYHECLDKFFPYVVPQFVKINGTRVKVKRDENANLNKYMKNVQQ